MAKVISVGLHIVDILGRPVSSIPDGQNVALLDEIRITVAGTAAGTSVDLAKLGADVWAVGAIGEDELGKFIVSTMGRYGIHTEGLVVKSGVQTSATMLPIRPNGDRPALHVPGANSELCWDDINEDLFEDAKFLHMGGTCLLNKFDGEPTRRLLEMAKSRGLTTTFDLVAVPSPDRVEGEPDRKLLDLIEPCLPFIDYFMPGLDEARMMCGLSDRQEVLKFFLDREDGPKHTVFKMGAEGSSIGFMQDGILKEIRIPCFRAPKVVDTTGCGDSYCAGFIVGLSMSWDLEQCGRLGAACGGLVVQGLGSDAGIVDLEKTIEFMRTADEFPMTE